MSTNHPINVEFTNATAHVKARIVLISFQEGDDYIVYSPHLEVTGYGKNQEEAMESFNHCLGVFLDYTVKKKTLHEELISLGWALQKGSAQRPKKIQAPNWSDLIQNNAELAQLLNTHDISTMQREVAIPV